MATSSILVKVLLIYFGINIMLFACGISVGSSLSQVVSNTDNSALTSESSAQNYTIGTIGGNLTPDVNQQTGGTTSSLLSFIDAIRAVRGLINFIGSMFFNLPFMFLLFPPAIQLFVGVPLALLGGIGLIFFARSGI